ncbi:MAG: HEAT repeat domain-containing protein [Methanomicrobiales archaeon]|nr:HEAT repeat domain-containing protein [Methanomicrobiales archaeon]
MPPKEKNANRPDDDKKDALRRHYLKMLEGGDEAGRWKAAEALGRLGDTDSVDALVKALSDRDWRVRQKAAWALKAIGDPRAIPHLRRLLNDSYEGVRDMAEEAIRELKMAASEFG